MTDRHGGYPRFLTVDNAPICVVEANASEVDADPHILQATGPLAKDELDQMQHDLDRRTRHLAGELRQKPEAAYLDFVGPNSRDAQSIRPTQNIRFDSALAVRVQPMSGAREVSLVGEEGSQG